MPDFFASSLPGTLDDVEYAVNVAEASRGTSKWNKIEHRIFSYITHNWRGRPLLSHEVVVNLIANTTTNAGLKIQAALNTKEYPTRIKISEQEMAAVKLKRNSFHGEWNYTIPMCQDSFRFKFK